MQGWAERGKGGMRMRKTKKNKKDKEDDKEQHANSSIVLYHPQKKE